MRKTGSLMEFGSERAASLVEAYRHEMKTSKVFNTRSAAKAVVHYPAPRFWVSEERAVTVVSQMMRGLPVLAKMSPCKRRMFLDIALRVEKRAQTNRHATLTDLVSQVIYSPAPEHYLEPSRALQVIYAEIKRRKNGKA